MSTYESTMTMARRLSESDLIKVREYISRLLTVKEEPVEVYNPYTPLSREEIVERLAIARKHAREGKVKDAHQASANIRAKYGL